MIICTYDRKKFLETIESRRKIICKDIDMLQNVLDAHELNRKNMFFLGRWFSEKPDYSSALDQLTSRLSYILKLRSRLEASESEFIYVDIDIDDEIIDHL